LADFLDIFGEDFSSVLASLDELPPEVETMLLGVMDKMVYDVKTFSNSLEKSVYTMQQAGTSPKIIKQTLANDMGTGGRIFGQLRNDTKASIVDGINQSAKMGQYKNYDLDKGEFAWVTVGGHKVCMDCDGRAGQKMTFAGWEAEGLPGSGWSVCQGFCYCVLDPTGKASKKIDAPVREPGPKIKPVTDSALYSKINKTENKIKTKKKEEFFAFNENGEIIFSRKGTESHVPFTNLDVLDMKANKVKVLTHNHPTAHGVKNATFSYQDISLTMKYDIPEIRAVGSDKVYSFKKGKNAISGGLEWQKIEKEILHAFNEAEATWHLDGEIYNLHKAKSITEFEAINMMTDKMLKTLSKKYGWVYKTEPI